MIHVHDSAPRSERSAPCVRSPRGTSQLVIDYRNDPGEPADPSGYYGYGQSEWEDIAGAVAYVVERGAESVILIGYSTGAAHILSYLYRTPDSRVLAAVFDSPNIDFEEAVDLGASQRRLPLIPLPLPAPLVWTAKRLSSIRSGSTGRPSTRSAAPSNSIPGARISRAGDDTVPLATSQEFSKRGPILCAW